VGATATDTNILSVEATRNAQVGAVSLVRRLSENEDAQARFMLVFDCQIYDADAAKWWADLAGMHRPAFEKQAADLVRPHGVLAMLRAVATASTGTLSGRDR
jgi:hypothetical protein